MRAAKQPIQAAMLMLLVAAACLGQSTVPVDTLRIESNLVDLKVSVVSLNPRNPTTELQQKDFMVLEDGQPQDIAFFAAAETPFDLVLLIDLSQSSNNKLKLIRKSANRFVEATRPTDRVSIVGFANEAQLICPLTQDRRLLKKSIDNIQEPQGGTRFWDSLRYVLAVLNANVNTTRRSAVVVMTDGVDNALPDVFGDGSSTSFDTLLQIVRESDAIVFPIYLDTEGPDPISKRTYADARRTLSYLADQSGGKMYYAKKIEDLTTVYDTVLKDVGTVYSLGFEPDEGDNKNRWRTLRVIIQSHPELKVKYRPGYFVK